VYLTPNQWDNKHRKVKNHLNAIRLNKQITDFIAKLEAVEPNKRNAGKPFTLEHLTEYLAGNVTDNFSEFTQREIKTSKLSKATITTHQTTLNTFCEFRRTMLFDEVTFELLSDFEHFLIEKKLSTNTIHKYFRHIKTYINLAINKGLFDLNRYPFRKFKVKTETTSREFLSPEELEALELVSIPANQQHLQKVLDMFLFSCYTGLRFSDMATLNKNSIRDINGDKWIDTTMIKTNEPIRIPLYLLFEGKPIEILNRYTKADNLYFFDDLTNQYVNRCLKDIADIAKIKKRITFHTARHTQATFLLYKGVSVTTVQKLLGHKKVQTTQIYSKVLDQTTVKELSNIKY
jgi:site-specific recombinase XerD